MTNKIGIGVEAQFDAGKVEQQINSLGQRVAQANKVQYTPISGKTSAELAKVLQQFDQLRRVQGDLNRRMKSTGQSGATLVDVDWEKLYPDQHSRARQMRKAFEYSTGVGFQESANQPALPPGAPRPPGQPPRPPGPTLGGTAAGVAQAGLRAAGPAGGVAANAMGTGMSAGFGAGLMGLVGGIAALGVGKLVSGVMEKMGEAEKNNVGLDTLKRTLGDVNVSFNALKAVVHGSADGLKITYDEAGRLSSQFVKLGNVTTDQYKTISDELGVGVGMSRSFGMDPSAGVGVMGQMRGIGVTTNTQDSKRFALLIGETIGKSNAFAKSEEVMEALAGYATSQTRNNMGAANVEGYAGMFSSMVGSGIAGLDPAGAGALLGRINASLSAGGAKGEASQFFTGSIGSSMGLNPYQTRMLREGGAFATGDGMFGDKSAYAAYKKLKPGDARPGGNTTFLEASLGKLRGQYGEGSDELADATANHLGIGINQAMGLLSLKPNQMGGLSEKYGDLTKFSSVSNLAQIEFGTADQRRGVAQSLLGRTGADAISSDDRAKINGAGTDEQLKSVLGEIAAKYDQERTLGSDIRDSKNVLDNIKTNLADKLVPIANEMRHGIMWMTGVKDGKSPKDIIEGVMRAEAKDKARAVGVEFDAKITGATGGADKMRAERAGLLAELRGNRDMSAEDKASRQKRIQEISEALAHEEERARNEIIELMKRKREALDKEVADLEKNIKDMRSAGSEAVATKIGYTPGGGTGDFSRMDRGQATAAAPGAAPDTGGAGAGAGAGAGGAAGGKPAKGVSAFVKEHGPLADKLAAKLGVPADAILGQWGLETGWGRSVIKNTNNLGNIKDFSGKGPTARDNMTGSVDSYRAYGSTSEFGDDFTNLLGKKRYAGALGTTDPRSYFSGLKKGGYAEDPNYVNKGVQAAAMAARARAAALPEGVKGAAKLPDEAGSRSGAGTGATPLPKGAVTADVGKSSPGATPLPDGAGARPGDAGMIGRITAEPITVIHQNKDGTQAAPPQQLQTKVSASKPFGVTAQ